LCRQQKKEMMVSIGQNTSAAEKLTGLLERMEHLLDEIDGLKDDLKDLKAQARDEGFNVAAVVRLVARRRNKQLASQENELLNDLLLYAHATGTPLDIAAVDEEPAASPTTTSPLDPTLASAQRIRQPNDDPVSESHEPT
jgi:uncharacterized protein (UPF0335 family)